MNIHGILSDYTAVNVCFQVEMATIQTQHIFAQIKNGSQAHFLLHHSSILSPKTLNMLLQQLQNNNNKRPFRLTVKSGPGPGCKASFCAIFGIRGRLNK